MVRAMRCGPYAFCSVAPRVSDLGRKEFNLTKVAVGMWQIMISIKEESYFFLRFFRINAFSVRVGRGLETV